MLKYDPKIRMEDFQFPELEVTVRHSELRRQI